MNLLGRLNQRGVPKVGGMYLVVSWLLLQFADITFDELGLPAGSLLTLLVILALGFPVALMLAWVYDLTPGGLVQTQPEGEGDAPRTKGQTVDLIIIAVLVVALGLTVWNNLGGDPEDTTQDGTELSLERLKSVAVLPFLSLSSDDSVGFFARGLSDGILDELAKSNLLRIASRTSSFQLAEANVELRGLARQLDVAYLIEGSVQQSGAQTRIIAQLIRAEDGYHVWSKTYSRLMDEGLAMQDAVAKNISMIASYKLISDVQRQHPELFEHLAETDPIAVKHFIDSIERYNDFIFGESGNLRHVLQLMEAAAAADPNFFAAHLELAWNYSFRTDPTIPIDEARVGAHAALNRAGAIEPDSTPLNFYLAQTLVKLDLDYAQAEELIQREVKTAPNSRWWHFYLAEIAMREGRTADAFEYLEQAQVIDYGEDRPTFLALLAAAKLNQAEFNHVLKITEEALALVGNEQSRHTHLLHRAEALLALGRAEEASTLLAQAWKEHGMRSPASFIKLYARLGDEARAREILELSEEKLGQRGMLVTGLLALGEIDRAFEIMRNGVDDHDSSILFQMRASRDYEIVRDDPRFLDLLAHLESKEVHTPSFIERNKSSPN